MSERVSPSDYLAKAVESLEGAASEYANRRYQNAANRSYYACFQAAIAALLENGTVPPADSLTWSHSAVQALFVGNLIHRRKRYPSTLRARSNATTRCARSPTTVMIWFPNSRPTGPFAGPGTSSPACDRREVAAHDTRTLAFTAARP